MSKNARRLKEFYIQPPLVMIETEHEKRMGRAKGLWCTFAVTTVIWVDQHVPEYRVAIPESTQAKAEILEHWDSIEPIEMRYITYVPTGRVVYDNTKPHAEAVVYEYILESLLGKKDLKHV